MDLHRSAQRQLGPCYSGQPQKKRTSRRLAVLATREERWPEPMKGGSLPDADSLTNMRQVEKQTHDNQNKTVENQNKTVETQLPVFAVSKSGDTECQRLAVCFECSPCD